MILQPVGRGGGSPAAVIAKFRWNKDLIGVKNGINTSFTTPDTFTQSGENVIRVYRNGQRLREGATNDYTVTGAGGLGTGVVLNGPAPLPYEEITADYLVP